MKAALYNFIAFLPAVVGMVIGVLMTRDITTATWIFAIAGGMFMYVSLVSIVSIIYSFLPLRACVSMCVCVGGRGVQLSADIQ